MKKRFLKNVTGLFLLLFMGSLVWGMCQTKAVAATPTAPLYKFGDINQDGKIDTTDLLKILRHIQVETSAQSLIDHPDWKLENEALLAADINQDGTITEEDEKLVLNHISAEKQGKLALIVTVTLKDPSSGKYYGCFPVLYDLSGSSKGYYPSLKTISKTGYTFSGWYTASSGGSRVYGGSSLTNKNDHILYAQWTKNSTASDHKLHTQWETQPNTTSIMPRTIFGLNYYDSNYQMCAIRVSTFKNSTGTQVQLQNSSKQTIDTTTGKGNTTVYFYGLDFQKIYYYRARAYYDTSGGRVYGAWSYRRAFSTCTVSVINGGSYTIRVKTPKVDGVKKFELWASNQSSQKGFKKVGFIKPGQAIKLSQINGNTLSYYGNDNDFYFFLKPYLNSGTTDGIYQRPGWTINSSSEPVREWYKQILDGEVFDLYVKCQEWKDVIMRYVTLSDFTYYNVRDINGDGIDELILATPRGNLSDDNRVLYLTYYQGKITPLICFDGNGARAKVKVKGGQIVLLNSESTGAYYIIYEINKDRVKKVKTMEYINYKYEKEYLINGRNVSYSRWNNEANALYNLADIGFRKR